MATVVKKVKRAGKRASKYQFTANFQSVVVECVKEKWLPHELSVAWSRRGRRHYTNSRLWRASPDNHKRGVVVWPELEEIEITVTLYKGQKDKKFELKEWEFAVIDMDETGKRKILATTAINMANYVSHLGLDQDLLLKLRPVSKKIKLVTLAVNLQSTFIKEGKATDDDMQSIASNLSYSKLSVIGVLEDGSINSRSPGGSFQDENGSRPTTPVIPPALIESQDELIKWAQRMTVGYRGLKITNMTTSWRNGLGFLAIIHHFRPNMVDYNELSAINVKQNNHLTCLLARELGISCTISPDHMVNATIPDKLAIASFVYQLYSFFNDNIPSAVTPVSNIPMLPGNGMEDFDKITMARLNSENSSVNNPSDQPKASSDRLKKYSRHRLDDDVVTTDQQLVNDNDATTSNGVAAELFPIVHAAGSNGVDESNSEETSDNVDEMFPKVSRSSAVKEEDAPTNEVAFSDIPDVVVNSPTDKSVLSRICAKSPEHNVAIEKKITAEEMTEDVVIVRRESSSQPTKPEPPLDNGVSEGQDVINLDVTVDEITEAKKQPEQRRRKLPSLPNMDANSSQSLKERAQEMLKQASEGSISLPAQDEAREAMLKERVQQMLISGKSESASAISKRIVKTGGVRVLGRAAPKPQIHVVQNTVITQQQKTPDTSSANVNSDSTQVSEKPNHNVTENVEKENSEELQKDSPEKKSEKEVEKQNGEVERDKTKDQNDKQEDNKVQRNAQPKKEPRKKRHHHMLSSEVKPVSKQPSASALSMASQPPTEKPVPIPRTIPISKAEGVSKEERDDEKDEGDMDNVNTTAIADERDEACSTPQLDDGIQSPDSMQSPSAWTSHSTDLAESILCSRSEFVVAELKQLQVKLKELDQKAGLIELDLRNAMDQGNKEREERLMKDWFQLLNEKNDVIRRQMELNLIEKEEDVERKEYLLRRELRTLSGISDDIKTKDQKDKEDKLLQALLKTVEERNNIEQRKMTTQAQKESEAAGFVKAQSRSADLARNNPASNPANNNCIIS